MKYLNKKFNFILVICFLIASLGLVGIAKADQTSSFTKAAGIESSATVGSIIAMVISAFLGFLGIIFVIQMIYAGFSWMTAAGNEDQVKKATALIRRSIIGLIIIVSAYAITYTVFTLLPGAGGGTGSGGGAVISVDSKKNK